MGKIRLFCSESLEENKFLSIYEENFHYLVNVMRCDIGSEVLLFNETNGEFKTQVKEINKKNLVLEIIRKIKYQNIENNFNIVFCPPKSHKLDILIQKCTELGVNSFIPVISDHTENRKLNISRLNKIIKESVEQSNQIKIPNIYQPISFDSFIKQNTQDQKSHIFFADIQSEINFFNLKIDYQNSNSIFIGPEGDFSVKELETLRSCKNFFSFSLGNRILRSETAAIASLVLFNNLTS